MTHPNNLLLPSEAKRLRDEGMATAEASANATFPIWSLRAKDSLVRYLGVRNGEPFMTEDFRIWAETTDNLPTPPTGRAYGAVMVKAMKAGLIKRVGYGTTKVIPAHAHPATIWIDDLPF